MQQEKFYEEWQKWILLSPDEKQKIRAEWDQYYKDVQETPIYLLFQEQRAASRKGDIKRVKDLADQARQMRENGDINTLPKPKSIDPFEFEHSAFVVSYHRIKNKIAELQQWEEEVPPEAEVKQEQRWTEPPKLS